MHEDGYVRMVSRHHDPFKIMVVVVITATGQCKKTIYIASRWFYVNGSYCDGEDYGYYNNYDDHDYGWRHRFGQGAGSVRRCVWLSCLQMLELGDRVNS